MINNSDILGQSFQFEYSNESYRIDILTETKLRWTRTKGESVGVSDEESYVFSRLAENLMMLTWIESDGLGLSNVLDLHNGVLTTHANQGRDVFVNTGKVETIK